MKLNRKLGVILLVIYEALILYATIKYPDGKAFEVGVIVFLCMIAINTLNE